MGNISNIVSVTITRGVRSITRAGFGTPLVLGPNAAAVFGADRIRTYTNMEGVEEDFNSTMEEHKMAARLFGQDGFKPRQIKIAKRSVEVAQVDTFTPVVANSALYTITLNGVDFSFTSDVDATAAEIAAGLIAAINAGAEPVTASGTNTVVLTADVAGIPFTASSTSNLTEASTVAHVGIDTDLSLCDEADKDWYGLLVTSHNELIQEAAADWTETRRKMFYYSSSDADLIASGNTTNIMSRLKAKNYTRSVGLYSADAASYPEAALMGGIFPRDPGSYTEKFKTLSGIIADDLTGTQEAAVKAKNGNVYTEIGGVSMVAEGKVAQGEFADVIRFVDWLQAQIEEGVFAKLVALPKVPFTNAGVAIIESEIRAALSRGIRFGGLAGDPAPTVTVPKVADVPVLDRAARILPDVKFDATLAGAIHFTTINGIVTV